MESKSGLVVPLQKLFKISLEQGVMPKEWKLANVAPVFNKGSKKDKGNYRPVSLTCHAGKIMEMVIKEEVVKFLEENKKILDSQHGFRQRRSCLTNPLDVTENLFVC